MTNNFFLSRKEKRVITYLERNMEALGSSLSLETRELVKHCTKQISYVHFFFFFFFFFLKI